MLNFKPRLLHAAMLLALPTLLAGYPHEDAFAQTANVSTSTSAGSLTQPAIWLAQTHMQMLNHPEPHVVVTTTGPFDQNLQFAEEKLNTHLKTTGEKMLKLAGGRNTLMKLDLSQSQGFLSPQVKAILYNKNGTIIWQGIATKPTVAPTSFEYRPGKVTHNLDASFRLMLPGQYLTTGAQLEVEVKETTPGTTKSPWRERFALNIGAPTVLPVTMFDFNLPGVTVSPLPSEAMLELGTKLLIKQLNFQRVAVNMDQFVFLPFQNDNSTIPHIRATSLEDWRKQAQTYSKDTLGAVNPRGVDHSQTMLTAMINAGGQMYISAYHGNFKDGTSGVFKGRGNSTMISSSTNASVRDAIGIFAHEFTHNLNLYHWHEQNRYKTYADKPYPYEGDMFGISEPTALENKTHNGPNWHYSPPTSTTPFGVATPPFRVDAENNKIYKRVISTSRAQDDKLITEQIGVFSDFDNRVSQHWLESVLRVHNSQTGKWSTWDQATGGYNKPVGGTAGYGLPRQAAPESVLSLVFATSVLNKAANLAYRPIGPYKSGIRFLYDPQNTTHRTQAKERAYCPAATLPSGGGCDYSVRVIQNGKALVYMLPIDDETNNMQRTVEQTDDNAVKHVAINVPALNGAVTEVTIYKTPNIERATGIFSIQSAEQLFYRKF